ncbi:MAG: YbaB/EbfC family nucleoid-associated protein [Sciscionella sp.]
MSAATERLLRRIEAIDTASADNRARADSYAALRAELQEVTGQASAHGGAISVTAAPGGVITDVACTDAVKAIAPQELARALHSALTQAQAEVARKQAELVRDRLGDTELLDRVLEQDREVFGIQPPQESSAPQGRHTQRRDEPTDDGDFAETFSVFEQASTSAS